MSKEKRVVFFEGKSWYHRTKELQDDLTTKYGKKGGFETPEEAEKSYWEYEKRYQKKQRDLQIAKMQKTDVMLGDYLEYWFENIFSPRIETTTRMVGAYTLYNLILPSMEADIKLKYISVEYLVIDITDDGPGLKTEANGGFGIRAVTNEFEILKTLYNTEIGITIENRQEKESVSGCHVQLSIPL